MGHENTERTLSHLAIIMDGNRRWAKEKGLPPFEGHKEGYKAAKRIAEYCFSHTQIKVLTLYTFSTENWKRTEEEVGLLMGLLKLGIEEQVESMHAKNIVFRVIGDINGFGPELQKIMRDAMEKTKNNTAGVLNLALNYGGRDEILHATKALIQEGVAADVVTEESFSSKLYTNGLPDPDMIMRTSGEQRLSGFLLWQAAYSELHFVKKHWPDFSEADIDAAIEEFAARERRFGA